MGVEYFATRQVGELYGRELSKMAGTCKRYVGVPFNFVCPFLNRRVRCMGSYSPPYNPLTYNFFDWKFFDWSL